MPPRCVCRIGRPPAPRKRVSKRATILASLTKNVKMGMAGGYEWMVDAVDNIIAERNARSIVDMQFWPRAGMGVVVASGPKTGLWQVLDITFGGGNATYEATNFSDKETARYIGMNRDKIAAYDERERFAMVAEAERVRNSTWI